MPKAEKGTPKDLANRMKSRGLQKLAFYCQVCEKQMRDQNGFKQHCASEPHVRMMLLVGQNPHQAISDYSRQFKHDFLQLLRTAHGEKRIQANHFYQEYIQNKSHIHMNGTHWKTLSEFVKGLGREGICRVDDGEKGLFISWIDNSPEALNRQAAIRKKDRQDKGDEERANQLIAEQIERARADIAEKARLAGEQTLTETASRRPEQKIQISFGFNKKSTEKPSSPVNTVEGVRHNTLTQEDKPVAEEHARQSTESASSATATLSNGMQFSMTSKPKKTNVFAALKTSTPMATSHSSSLDKKGLSNAQQMIKDQEERQRRQRTRT